MALQQPLGSRFRGRTPPVGAEKRRLKGSEEVFWPGLLMKGLKRELAADGVGATSEIPSFLRGWLKICS